MKKYLNDIKTIKNRQFKAGYRYDYYELSETGLIQNKNINDTRDSFEAFKILYNVSIPGEISLRIYTDKDSDKILGYVAEEKIIDKTDYALLEKIYNEAYGELLVLLNVKDLEAFETYLDTYIFSQYCFERHDFHLFKIKEIVELYEEYNSDEDLKKFIDKIVK